MYCSLICSDLVFNTNLVKDIKFEKYVRKSKLHMQFRNWSLNPLNRIYTSKMQNILLCKVTLCLSNSANGKRLVGFGTGECGNYVETTICQPLITILLQQQNKSPLLHRTQLVAVFFVRSFPWFTPRSLIIGNTLFLI